MAHADDPVPAIVGWTQDVAVLPQNARGRQDVINLSHRGRIVAEAARAVHTSSDVREAKVAALKAAIANGSYSSNAREIAERLVANGLGS